MGSWDSMQLQKQCMDSLHQSGEKLQVGVRRTGRESGNLEQGKSSEGQVSTFNPMYVRQHAEKTSASGTQMKAKSMTVTVF